MRKIGTTLAACAMLLAFGCDSRGGGGTDAGGIVLMDSGPGMTGTDAGPGMTGTDAGGGGGMFAPCTANSPLPQNIASSSTPVCAASTATCLEGCTDNACADACIMADPNATMCNQCIVINQLSCVNTTCPTDMMLGCIDTTCAAANSAWETCADGVVSGCGAAISACFMAP